MQSLEQNSNALVVNMEPNELNELKEPKDSLRIKTVLLKGVGLPLKMGGRTRDLLHALSDPYFFVHDSIDGARFLGSIQQEESRKLPCQCVDCGY